MKKRISIFLIMALLCACFPPPALGADAADEPAFVPAERVEIGKTYVLVADGQYALTNRQEGPALHEYADGAETTLASAPVTVENGVISGEIGTDMLWTVAESTAPEAYDGMEQYFLQDVDGRYLRRGSGSLGEGAQLVADPEQNEKIRFYTWSFYPYGDGSFAMYANSERAYGRDYPYYLYANETSFDSPSKTTRTASEPFAFAEYDDCARIQLFEAVDYEPCEHEYGQTVVPPTCTGQGYTLHLCAKCGSSYKTDYVDELLHAWPKDGEVTKEPTDTERGELTFTCTRCGAVKTRPLAAGSEQAHKDEILFISDLHSGKNAENGYHNLRAMFRLLRENDGFVPEVVAGGGDYMESRTYDDADWPHSFEVLHDIMYDASPDTAQALTSGNHEWEWSRMSEDMIELLLGSPRVGNNYSGEDFEIFQIGAHTNDAPKEEFLDEDIEKLRAFLASVSGSGKVIFIQTHWPLHYGYNSDSWRTTENADEMIDLLNEYSETLDICFVWGHNHNEDEYRHKCFVPGDELQYSKKESKQIQFTYVNAGCLNERHAKEGAGPEDSKYGPGYLLEARIVGDKLILDYGHITGAWPDPDEAEYDHDADLLYVEEIQEARPSHHEIQLRHRSECAHDYQAAVTAPTCTEGGFTTWTCTKCGNSYQDSETAALGHNYRTAVTAPTCTEAGFTTYTCSRCGETHTGDETAALGHDYRTAVTAPTCTKPGFTTYTCSRCGETHTGDETAALDHDWDEGRVTTEPTETEPGVRTFTCRRCSETRTEAIPELDHEHRYTAAVTPPTCTEAGYTTYTCSCGASYTDDEIPALGHAYEDGVCIRCGKADPDYVPPVDKSGLSRAVAAAGELREEDYTPETFGALKEAVEAAEALMARDDVSQTEIDAAAKAVNDAIDALEPAAGKADKKELAKALAAAETVDKDRYTDGSVKALEEAVEAANAVMDREDAAQDAVDAAAKAVNDAIGALEEKPVFLFDDVQDPAKFYFDPVYWAYYAGPQITNGVDATHFGPDLGCTRGQVVTFLWRAAGCPEPGRTETGFTDLKDGGFYVKAVAWAVENGITNGMTATTFAPDATCTRGQIVTFLWRFRGKPEPAAEAGGTFADVEDTAFYASAVAWAVENEVTNGMTAAAFGPKDTCTRGQIVTFLYRAANG